ncbi:DUF481 domain-containing protein [Pseudoalteromonas sp. YIC-656]|uniref:DUF481 domain-containing protein n=1 Tax=Pseudoalteromonas pernae TaxID=3118054 RepID=UPI00324274FD
MPAVYITLFLTLFFSSLAMSQTSSALYEQEREVLIKANDEFDWLRLTSGEWLKGEFKAMYDKNVEFESDILDTLFIDRDDVQMLISKKILSIRFNDGTVREGNLLIGPETVSIADSKTSFNPSDIVSVAPSAKDKGGAWYAKVGLGANLSRGNTEQTEYSATVDIKRRTATNRLLINALAARTSNDEEVTENNIRANGTFDWFYTTKLYFRPVFFEYYRDPFQNIANKYSLGAGLGYYVVDTDKLEWDIGAGPAFQRTEFDTVAVGEKDTNSSASFYIASNLDYELTSDIDLMFDYRFTFSPEEAGGNAQHALAGASIDITKDIDFDISLVWDYLEAPIANSDGTVPKQDDYKMIFSFGVEL